MASLASAPLLQKKARRAKGVTVEQGLGQLDLPGDEEVVGDVPERVRLLLQGADQGRVAVAQHVHGHAAQEVVVGVAFRVEQADALPADHGDAAAAGSSG